MTLNTKGDFDPQIYQLVLLTAARRTFRDRDMRAIEVEMGITETKLRERMSNDAIQTAHNLHKDAESRTAGDPERAYNNLRKEYCSVFQMV